MKNTKRCPKCSSLNIVLVPDNQNRHASGNNIYTSTFTLIKKIPVIRYVCCDCGYVEIKEAKARRSTQSYANIGGVKSGRQSKKVFVDTLSDLRGKNKNEGV